MEVRRQLVNQRQIWADRSERDGDEPGSDGFKLFRNWRQGWRESVIPVRYQVGSELWIFKLFKSSSKLFEFSSGMDPFENWRHPRIGNLDAIGPIRQQQSDRSNPILTFSLPDRREEENYFPFSIQGHSPSFKKEMCYWQSPLTTSSTSRN